MYPKNAASPPEIAIGAVVQISDGAVQTSGCSVVVRPKGGSESAGGGTLAYGASSGIVYYTPTQAETNYEEFSVAVYKTGCIPVAVTIITTQSATAGQAVCADTQKVDLNSIKTQAVTCAAGVTIGSTVAQETGGNLAAVKAKTDNLPTDPADESLIIAATDAISGLIGTPAGASVSADIAAVKSDSGAIKAKTDNLPASPAAVGSQMDLQDAPNATALAAAADALLNRDMSTGTDSGSPTVRTVRQALRFLRNKWALVSTTLTVYKEDDTTASWTSTVAKDASAEPITSNDPADS